MSNAPLVAHALRYAGGGINVFPVNGKEPLTAHGFHDATTDREQIETWWARHPSAGIGTPDFDIVDVDLYKPEAGPTWARIKPLIPEGTACTKTGGGGLQYLFAAGSLREGKIGPGVDSRYAGRGYGVLPPSPHPSGTCYEAVVDVLLRRPKPAPDFPYDPNGGGTAAGIAKKITAGAKITEDRNTSTFWYAVRVIEAAPNVPLEDVEQAVRAWVNSHCAGDLAEVDVAKQVRGATKWVAEHGRNGASVPAAPAAKSDELEWLHEFELRAVEYVDRPLIQAATFHLVGGRPGVGKGALCAYWVARCTSGALYGEPRVVLWLSSEDDPSIDLGPRVEAAGGTRSLVALIPYTFQLPDGVGWLRDTVRRLGNVGLVIIDPLSNHTGRANTDREEEVRTALMPLGIAAAELHVPILGIRHISTKEAKGDALGRILGSTAWIGVPRVVLAAVKDRENPDLVHVHPVKGNRVRTSEAGRRFQLEGRLLPGFAETVVVAIEDGVSDADIDTLLTGGAKTESASERARELLIETLREAGGRMESDQLDATVAKAAGLAAKTIQNLRSEMRTEGWLRAIPEKDDEGTILRWFVALTNAIPEERPDPLARGGMEQSGSGLFKPNPGTTSRDPAPTRGRDLAPAHAPGRPSADVEITFEEWAAENDI